MVIIVRIVMLYFVAVFDVSTRIVSVMAMYQSEN